MGNSWKVWVVLLALISVALLIWISKLVFDKSSRDQSKAEAMEYLDGVEITLEDEFRRNSEFNWQCQQNTTEDNVAEIKFKTMQAEKESEEFLTQLKVNVSQRLLAWKTLNSSSTLGQKLRTILGLPTFLLPQPKVKTLRVLEGGIRTVQEEERERMRMKSRLMPSLYPLPNHVTDCQNDKILSLPEWTAYYNAVGNRIKPSQFIEYMEVLNEEALLGKSPSPIDLSVQATFDLSASNVGQLLNNIWTQLLPLYREFHAYLREELRFAWTDEPIAKNGLISAHMLESIGTCPVVYFATKPYSENPDPNLAVVLNRKRYTIQAMAKVADDFLSSVGFQSLSALFFEKSILVRPPSNPLFNCTPQLFEVNSEKKREYRISLCGVRDEQTLLTVNQLLVQGTLQSILLNDSFILRQFANLGLRQGIAEGFLLGMSSVPYLHRLGVVLEFEEDLSLKLNRLYRELFDLFSQITKALVYYRWTYDAYHLKIKPVDYSRHYWKLRLQYEGVAPMDSRNSAKFDPAVHPYLIQTSAKIVEPIFKSLVKYATYESLCLASESFPIDGTNRSSVDILKNCDFFGRPAVGERMSTLIKSTLLSPLKSFEIIFNGKINLTHVDASAMLNYFNPIYTHLKETNKRREASVGW